MPNHIELYPREIVLIDGWNCRQETVSTGKAEDVSGVMTDEQLEISIARDGVLQPPMVRHYQDQWCAIFGFRRVRAAIKMRPDEKLVCPVMPEPGSEEDAEVTAQIFNLSENIHRQNLRPWEIAEALLKIKQKAKLNVNELAARCGFHPASVSNLLRIKQKSHPKIWAQYKRWGASLKISSEVLRRIIMLPQDEQLEAWKQALHYQKIGKRGKQKRPGPAKLKQYLDVVRLVENRSPEWKRGAKFAFQVALGLKAFSRKGTAVTTKESKE